MSEKRLGRRVVDIADDRVFFYETVSSFPLGYSYWKQFYSDF